MIGWRRSLLNIVQRPDLSMAVSMAVTAATVILSDGDLYMADGDVSSSRSIILVSVDKVIMAR